MIMMGSRYGPGHPGRVRRFSSQAHRRRPPAGGGALAAAGHRATIMMSAPPPSKSLVVAGLPLAVNIRVMPRIMIDSLPGARRVGCRSESDDPIMMIRGDRRRSRETKWLDSEPSAAKWP